MKKKIRDPKQAHLRARKRRTARSVALSERPRLTVYRSARHIYAQLVEPHTGRTLGTISTRDKSVGGGGATGNVESAKKVGQAVAEMARKKQIQEVVFNRNGFLYHGRVKALAEAAREAGLRF